MPTTLSIRITIRTLPLLLFAFFAAFEFPFKLIAFISLAVFLVLFSRDVVYSGRIRELPGLSVWSGRLKKAIPAALLLGIMLAALYNYVLKRSLFPSRLTQIAFLVFMVGAAEELIFRGYLFSLLKEQTVKERLLLISLLHAMYKTVFTVPLTYFSTREVGYVFVFTFLAGLAITYLREYSENVLPSVISHGLFDVLVYGSLTSAPFWLW